jgi:hypothetical protein
MAWFCCFLCYFYMFYLFYANGISEYFFLNEFGVCYSLIAVNYLIYTNEVIGNIMESYPVIPLFSAFVRISGINHLYFIVKNQKAILKIFLCFTQKLKYQESISPYSILLTLPYLSTKENPRNVFAAMNCVSMDLYKFYFVFCIAN